MDIQEKIYRGLSYVESLEALVTLIEETAGGHPYTMRFCVDCDGDDDEPCIEITRTRPETPDEETRRQKIEMSAEERRKWDILQVQRRAEVERILGHLSLEELRKCQTHTKEETA